MTKTAKADSFCKRTSERAGRGRAKEKNFKCTGGTGNRRNGRKPSAIRSFCDLGNGLSGLVHISQICEKRIKKPSEVLSVGDRVKVKVTAVKDGKLSLSIKEASDMMAKDIEEEVYEVPDAGEEATTSLGSLFAGIKLD